MRNGLQWIVKAAEDSGPRDYYRWHVAGEIWDSGRFRDTFDWRIHSLDDFAYELDIDPGWNCVQVLRDHRNAT